MNALAPVAPRLGQLVRLLGSDKSGEIVAAAGAIGRTLHSVGADWHDFAIAVEQAALPVVVDQPRHEPQRELPDWQELARQCLIRGAGRLRSAESDFVRSMVTWPSEPSAKQWRWLSAIAMSLDVEVPA